MFGYVTPDEPYLYKKDDILYKAMYCGTCKCLGKSCGQRARLTLTYDITFLSVFLHNVLGQDVKIKKQRCITHCVKAKQMALKDDIGMLCADVNVILAYNKVLDDVIDNNKGKIKKFFLKKSYKKAKKHHCEIDNIVKEEYSNLRRYEKENCDSLDIICDPFANMLKRISVYCLKDKSTSHTENLFYQLGKWIYLIDAMDDMEKDKKNKNYNPLNSIYQNKTLTQIVSEKNDLTFTLNTIFSNIKDEINQIKFYFNSDLIENILIRGLASVTRKVINKERKHG